MDEEVFSIFAANSMFALKIIILQEENFAYDYRIYQRDGHDCDAAFIIGIIMLEQR
jgi:hypothetical protein